MAITINGSGGVTGLTALPDSAMTSGSVIKVKSAFSTGKITTSSTSFQDIPGLDITITPTSSSSKFLIFVNMGVSHQTTSGTLHLGLARTISGTTTYPSEFSDSDDTTNKIHFGNEALYGMFSHSAHFLDSPNTTSAVNYKYQVRTYSSSVGTVSVGVRNGSNQNDLDQTQNLTVMEIVG